MSFIAPTCRLVTLGCKVNQYESQYVKEALELGKTFIRILVSAHLILPGARPGVAGRPEASSHDYE